MPNWTVLYSVESPESDTWIGTGWEFFDREEEAEDAFRRLTREGKVCTKRPFHMNDRIHLGAVHRA